MATAVASNTSKLGKGPHKELRHNHAFSLLATKQKVSIIYFSLSTTTSCHNFVQSRLHVSNVIKFMLVCRLKALLAREHLLPDALLQRTLENFMNEEIFQLLLSTTRKETRSLGRYLLLVLKQLPYDS